MKIEEIRELKEMGFSNQEILQFATSGEVTRTIETPEQPEQPEQPAPEQPEQPEQPAPETPKQPEQPEQDKTIEELKQTISGMQNEMKSFISTMQKNNLQSATFDMLPNETLQENAVTALSELIRPTINEGENKK